MVHVRFAGRDMTDLSSGQSRVRRSAIGAGNATEAVTASSFSGTILGRAFRMLPPALKKIFRPHQQTVQQRDTAIVLKTKKT